MSKKTKKPPPKPAAKSKAKPTKPTKPSRKPKPAKATGFRRADGTVGELDHPPEPTAKALEEARALSRARQSEIAGTEQVRDDQLEQQWSRRAAAVQMKTAATNEIQLAEAAIEVRFAELAASDPSDARAQAYTAADGSVLRPQRKFRLAVTRPPKRRQADDAEPKEDEEGDA